MYGCVFECKNHIMDQRVRVWVQARSTLECLTFAKSRQGGILKVDKGAY